MNEDDHVTQFVVIEGQSGKVSAVTTVKQLELASQVIFEANRVKSY